MRAGNKTWTYPGFPPPHPLTDSLALVELPMAFRAMEHAGWSSATVVPAYEAFFGPLTSQCVPDLLQAVNARQGCRLLDVATGHGPVALSALECGCAVTALDFSAAFLDRAKASAKSKGYDAAVGGGAPAAGSLRLVEGDAQELPFEDSCFDAVVCNYGVLHLTDPESFFKEAYRVLAPGGRLAFTVWCAPPEAVPFDIVLSAVRDVGNPNVDLPAGPLFFQYADAGVASASLLRHGFDSPCTSTVAQHLSLARADDLYALFAEGTVRTRALLRQQTPVALAGIRRRMASDVEARAGRALACPCRLTSARKPTSK